MSDIRLKKISIENIGFFHVVAWRGMESKKAWAGLVWKLKIFLGKGPGDFTNILFYRIIYLTIYLLKYFNTPSI